MKVLSKPDFICIGPTKTGTTWLFANLNKHPEVWLPPVKEVHYFWGQGRQVSPGAGMYRALKQQLLGNINYKWRYKYLKRRLGEYFDRSSATSLHEVYWDLKYTFLPQTSRWYERLFDKEKVSGDITPGYYTLGDEEISLINRHLPRVKVIMILRDPVERLWSEAKMHLLALTGQSIENVPPSEFYRRFEIVHGRCPSYAQFVQNWQKVFGDRLFIGYYDELRNDPEHFFRSICEFLEIDMPETEDFRAGLGERIWKGVDKTLPEDYRKYLSDLCLPCISEYSAYSNSPYPGQWFLKYVDKDEYYDINDTGLKRKI